MEDKFAKEFLDRLGLKYVRQYEAKDIKRFYDFAVRSQSGAVVLIEIDGDYFHGHGLVHEEKNRMQKHSEWVDKIKDQWAQEHRLMLIRIWEHEINETPSEVMKMLREKIGEEEEKQQRRNNKAKRH